MALAQQTRRPDLQEILDRRGSSAPPEVVERVHRYVERLDRACDADLQEKLGKMRGKKRYIDKPEEGLGRKRTYVEKVMDDIWIECKRDPIFRKEWEETHRHMLESYEEMKKENVFLDGGPRKRDPAVAYKAEHLETLIKNMKNADRG